MLEPASTSFIERVWGVLRLQSATYEEIEHDTAGTGQAALVVTAAAILSGAGSPDGRVATIFGAVLTGLLFWALYAMFAFVVGAYLLKTPETSATTGEVLRALGFAYAPTGLGVFAFVPGIGPIVVLAGFIWWLATSVVALRQVFEVSTGRAVAIGVIAFGLMIIVVVLMFTILGIGIAALVSLLAT